MDYNYRISKIAMECANINGSGVERIWCCIDHLVFGAPVVDRVLTGSLWNDLGEELC
jgi:hypothetical protein